MPARQDADDTVGPTPPAATAPASGGGGGGAAAVVEYTTGVGEDEDEEMRAFLPMSFGKMQQPEDQSLDKQRE